MQSSETYDPAAGVISFTVKVAGRVVPCHVSTDWLRDSYGVDVLEPGPLLAFQQRRAAIEATALKTWLASQGAEPVRLKRAHVWRQRAATAAEPQALGR